jgi:hypothetical protein
MGDERPGPPPTSLLDGVAQPLNRWAVYGADEEEEVWSYGASWTVTQAIVEEVGLDALSAVVTAAADDEIAYLGDAAPERGYLRHDWRLYLDLIENRGGVEGDEIQDIFVAWVLTETEASSLEVRAEARTRYAELEHDGGHWAPPLGVRVAMSDWNFDEADELLGLASSLLDERDRIEDVLDPLGASLPGRLEASYEGADGGFDETTALMGEVSAAAGGLWDSHDRIEAATGVLQRIGGIGSDHRDDLEAAVDAFEAGELDRAARAAAEIDRDVAGLTRAGLGRLALAALFIAGSVGVVVWLARRRQRGPGAPPAVVSSPRSLPPAPSGGPWSREVPGSPEARGAPHGPAHRGWWRPGLPPPWRRRSERPTQGPGRTRPAPGDT